jgi:phosphatidylethanolamine-binding protein (PEBP) family uncharacterized protein
MASSSKRQTTMAKFSREQALRERRARKQEKKDDRKQAALAPELSAEDESLAETVDDDEAPVE